jgi:hypothetical protein
MSDILSFCLETLTERPYNMDSGDLIEERCRLLRRLSADRPMNSGKAALIKAVIDYLNYHIEDQWEASK